MKLMSEIYAPNSISNMSCLKCLLLALCFLMCFMTAAPAMTWDQKMELTEKLLNQTDHRVATADEISVDVTLKIWTILEFNDIAQTLTSVLEFKFEWNDGGLIWDIASYPKSAVRLPVSDIWKPTFVVNNGATGQIPLFGNDDDAAKVSYNGDVYWMGTHAVTTTCTVDITYYPFDSQSCTIVLYTTSYSTDVVSVGQLTLDTPVVTENSLWEIVSQMANTYDDPTFYIQIKLELKRRSTVHMGTDVLPPIILLLLGTISFIVPIESGEKLSFSVSNFLSTIVYVTYTANQCPRTALTQSIFVIYLGYVMGVCVVNVVMTATTVNIANWSGEVDGIFKKIQQMTKRVGEEEIAQTVSWYVVARKMDKCFLVISIVMSVIPSAIVIGLLLS